MVLAVSRDAGYVTEQPSTSLLFHHPSIEQALDMTSGSRQHTHLGSFGHQMLKPTVLWHTLGNAGQVLHRSPQLFKAGKKVKGKEDKRSTPYAKSSNGRWINGGSALRGSEEYPSEFCEALVVATLSARKQVSHESV